MLTSSESTLLDSNPLLYNQRSILVNPDVRQYHPNMMAPTSWQVHSLLEAQRLLCSIDLFRINATTLLHLLHLLPPRFPSHIDSIRANLFSQQISSFHIDPIDMLEWFRHQTISAHAYSGSIHEVPTMFSYAKANHYFIPTQFGVSAPRSQCGATLAAAVAIREYRLRQCWGEQKPPANQESWRHGHCAESQSLSSVVACCEDLGLENVFIETLAVNKSGKFVGMCKNCMVYILYRILHKHPTWRIYDVYTMNVFQIA